jgi:hypothetical protein
MFRNNQQKCGFVGAHVLHMFAKLNHFNLNLKAGGYKVLVYSIEDAVRAFHLS